MPLRCGGSLCKVQDDKRLLPLIGEGRDGEHPARGLFLLRHSVLYKANRRNEVRTSEPVCRADTESPASWECVNKHVPPFAIRPTMRFRVAFGLFGWSENSSFPSTLRAWFAFAHSSPYRKSNRNRSPP